MPRLSPDLQRHEYLVDSIVSLATQTAILAVDTVSDAIRADIAGHPALVAEHLRRLAAGVGVTTTEIAWLAAELEASTARDDVVAAAGAAVTELQSSLLSVAAAVQEIADAGGPAEIFASAGALRHAALQLDELLPSFQPSR